MNHDCLMKTTNHHPPTNTHTKPYSCYQFMHLIANISCLLMCLLLVHPPDWPHPSSVFLPDTSYRTAQSAQPVLLAPSNLQTLQLQKPAAALLKEKQSQRLSVEGSRQSGQYCKWLCAAKLPDTWGQKCDSFLIRV